MLNIAADGMHSIGSRGIVLISIHWGLGASTGALAGACLGGGSSRWLYGAAAAIASAGFQELGERSASAPRVRMRCDANSGNHACECKSTNERCTRRQLASKCQACERVELQLFGSHAR
eukprot:6211895-Pleurochrysis_carterae.AAC.1